MNIKQQKPSVMPVKREPMNWRTAPMGCAI